MSGSLAAQSSLDDLKFNVFQNLNNSVHQNYIRLLNESEQGKELDAVFEFDDWTPMLVTDLKDQQLKLDSCNYHLEDETIFFLRDNKLYYLFPSQIKSAAAGERVFIPVSEKNTKHGPFKYYELLAEGKMILLKDVIVEKRKINNHPMGIDHGVIEYENTIKTKFYYSHDGLRSIHELPRSKNKLIKLFRSNRNRMVEFARDNQISPRSEQDLKAMFTYYNNI